MSESQSNGAQWILRIAVLGEFLGHGVLALTGKPSFITLIENFTGFDAAFCGDILLTIGVIDIIVALIVLFRPVRLVLVYATFWGFVTALARPLYGGVGWLAFVERAANWGAPLGLLLLRGRALTARDWLR